MCIDIVEIGLGLLMGKFDQFLTELFAHDAIKARYYRFTFLLIFLFSFGKNKKLTICLSFAYFAQSSKRKIFIP